VGGGARAHIPAARSSTRSSTWPGQGVPGGELPGDLPHWATAYDYFAAWKADGTVDRIHGSA